MYWTKVVAALAIVPGIVAKPLFMLNSANLDTTVHKVSSRDSLMARADNPAGQDKYTVVSGDTQTSIGAAFSTTNNALSQANPNVDFTTLTAGQVINMPSSRTPLPYTIKNGDTQSSISSSFGIFNADLSKANPGVFTQTLVPGTNVRVPAYGRSRTYTVVSGDMGYPIAAAFGITFQKLSDANPNVNWSALYIGQVLNIPAGVSPITGTAPPPSSSSTTTTTSTTTSTTTVTPTTTVTTTTTRTGTTTTTTTTSVTPTSTTTRTSTGTPTSTTTSTTTRTTTTTTSTTTTTTTTTSKTSVTASVTGPLAVKSPVVNNDGNGNNPDVYTFYQGDGSTGARWPAKSQWASFDLMWSRVKPYLGQQCQNLFKVPNNSDQENSYILTAINSVAERSGVDHRLILATIVQESSGCVRAPTTNNGESNPGLMQDYNGKATCNGPNGVLTPCPFAQVYNMVIDGTMGTNTKTDQPAGGLVQHIQSQSAYPFAQAYYRSSRLYNAGSIPSNGDLGAPGATRCYVSDIANRLMGWVTATRTCTLT